MEKRNIKMIGLDLDGTLLNSDKQVSAYTKDVLQKTIDQGVIVLPVTGRPLTGIPKEVMELPGIRYAVTANGARVEDVIENKVLHQAPLAYETAKELMEFFEQYDTYREVYFDGHGYATESRLEHIGEYMFTAPMVQYMLTTRRRVKDVYEFLCEKQAGVDKLLILFRNVEERKRALKAAREAVPGAVLTSALANNIEANSIEAQKGLALLRLGEILEIKQEEIMTCGDGENDVDMIQRVGFGVAMGNGVESVKAYADYITETNDEDGVAKAIEKFVLK